MEIFDNHSVITRVREILELREAEFRSWSNSLEVFRQNSASWNAMYNLAYNNAERIKGFLPILNQKISIATQRPYLKDIRKAIDDFETLDRKYQAMRNKKGLKTEVSKELAEKKNKLDELDEKIDKYDNRLIFKKKKTLEAMQKSFRKMLEGYQNEAREVVGTTPGEFQEIHKEIIIQLQKIHSSLKEFSDGNDELVSFAGDLIDQTNSTRLVFYEKLIRNRAIIANSFKKKWEQFSVLDPIPVMNHYLVEDHTNRLNKIIEETKEQIEFRPKEPHQWDTSGWKQLKPVLADASLDKDTFPALLERSWIMGQHLEEIGSGCDWKHFDEVSKLVKTITDFCTRNQRPLTAFALGWIWKSRPDDNILSAVKRIYEIWEEEKLPITYNASSSSDLQSQLRELLSKSAEEIDALRKLAIEGYDESEIPEIEKPYSEMKNAILAELKLMDSFVGGISSSKDYLLKVVVKKHPELMEEMQDIKTKDMEELIDRAFQATEEKGIVYEFNQMIVNNTRSLKRAMDAYYSARTFTAGRYLDRLKDDNSAKRLIDVWNRFAEYDHVLYSVSVRDLTKLTELYNGYNQKLMSLMDIVLETNKASDDIRVMVDNLKKDFEKDVEEARKQKEAQEEEIRKLNKEAENIIGKAIKKVEKEEIKKGRNLDKSDYSNKWIKGIKRFHKDTVKILSEITKEVITASATIDTKANNEAEIRNSIRSLENQRAYVRDLLFVRSKEVMTLLKTIESSSNIRDKELLEYEIAHEENDNLVSSEWKGLTAKEVLGRDLETISSTILTVDIMLLQYERQSGVALQDHTDIINEIRGLTDKFGEIGKLAPRWVAESKSEEQERFAIEILSDWADYDKRQGRPSTEKREELIKKFIESSLAENKRQIVKEAKFFKDYRELGDEVASLRKELEEAIRHQKVPEGFDDKILALMKKKSNLKARIQKSLEGGA